MTKVLIADDHPLFRRGLKQLLFSISDQWQVDEAGNGQEILDRIWQEDYDLVFLDIGLPGRSGLEMLEEIMRAKPETRALPGACTRINMPPSDKRAPVTLARL
jgi:DNA-binding NarL/FixJ family response regulator